MKNIYKSFLVLTISFFIFSAHTVSAKIITSENGVVMVEKGEIVNDDMIIGAQTAEIDGTVNGDVFIGAQSVKIAGVINGNLHVGANMVDISGAVNGNVYGGAQNVLINGGTVRGSLLVGASSVNVDKNSTIGGSIFAGAGTLTIDSEVKRNVFAGAGNLHIGSDAKIGKDLYYATSEGKNNTSISKSARIIGTTHKTVHKDPQRKARLEEVKKQTPAVMGGAKFFMSIFCFFGALVVGFLYLKLFGKHFTHTSNTITQSFWKSFGVGFLVIAAFIPGLIMLMITVIGIPLAGVVFILFLLFSYLAKLVAGLAFGEWISNKFSWKLSPFVTFALGLVAIYVLGAIPFIGFLTGLTAFWAGLGALTLGMFSKA